VEIRDFDSSSTVQAAEKLDSVLARRFEVEGSDANSFWLSHDDEYPCMLVLVRDGLATLWYTPHEGMPGFVSAGPSDHPAPDLKTTFYCDRQKQETPNRLVVTFPEALQAAHEFLRSPSLPASLRWIEL
jgi:hypothetical protein